MVDFSEWLAAQMEKNDWNKSAVAVLMDIHPSTVASWLEKKPVEIRPDKLIKLAEITGENPFILFHWVYGLPLPENITGPTSGDLRPKEKQILERLHNVSEPGLDLLIDQITHVLSPRFVREKTPNGRET